MKAPGRAMAVVATALAAVFSLAAAPPQEEEPPRCRGRLAKIIGTDDADDLLGTPGRDVIWAGLGDDKVHAGLGNDLVCGGPGADVLHGGRGNDTVDGGAGDGDQAIGDLGDDLVIGGAGDFDEVAGSLGIDVLNGGSGSFDLVHGDYGYDRMDGGLGGGDIASFATDVASPRGRGVWASLADHRALGDGHDRLFRFEGLEGSAFEDVLIGDPRDNAIDGGPGDDELVGGKGRDQLSGGQGTDSCKGAKGHTTSCRRQKPFKASAYVELDRTPIGGGGLAIVGGPGRDEFTVGFDRRSATFGVTAAKGIALGQGCVRVSAVQASCAAAGPARWLMADLGGGADGFRVEGDLSGAENVRIAGGPGNDTIRGGPEDDLIEAGFGSDHLYGGPGADGLIGSLPGPTVLNGGKHGDLLAAGGGCAGGAIVGGPGRDDASFAETQAHPGTLIVSFPLGKAWIDAIPDCDPVLLADSNEDMEGSFDEDILIGDGRKNALLGQPGRDRFYGGGGDDVVDARDGVRDFYIQCGRGRLFYPRERRGKKVVRGEPVLLGTASGRALTDSFDPGPALCTEHTEGTPVPGLNHNG